MRRTLAFEEEDRFSPSWSRPRPVAVAGACARSSRRRSSSICSKPPASEAKACFGNGDVIWKSSCSTRTTSRFQVLGDTHGNYVHLGERDCSMQRRNQKIIEECPSPPHAGAAQAHGRGHRQPARAIGYENAGTIEYLVDDKGENFYFMEMNTRIQVEHPVTEEVIRRDLIKEQIRVAAGQPLSQHVLEQLFRAGHAIECRINAEDPYNNFAPCPGKSTCGMPPAAKACGWTPTSIPATPCRRTTTR
jgi:acetyl-CoA carboxylase, biotin carboxylase subunit